jgi:hypothetical protein
MTGTEIEPPAAHLGAAVDVPLALTIVALGVTVAAT